MESGESMSIITMLKKTLIVLMFIFNMTRRDTPKLWPEQVKLQKHRPETGSLELLVAFS